MPIITIKGHDINAINVKDSFNRRSIQFRNNIFAILRKIDVVEDDIDIPLENVAFKKAPASVSWYFDRYNLHYSYAGCNKFVENLYVVQKLLELEVTALIEGKRTVDDFVAEFREEHDVAEKRKIARESLGLEHGERDIGVIDKAYKSLAKKYHPDVNKEEGAEESFKEINKAHKILKRELL